VAEQSQGAKRAARRRETDHMREGGRESEPVILNPRSLRAKSLGLSLLEVPLMLLLLFVQRPVPGLAWGDRGHQLINAAAVDNLPQPLRAYFRARKVYLVEHASDPDLLAHDDPAERPHHYTDLDADDTYPFPRLRQQFVLEKALPKPWQLRNGDSIWQIERFTVRLADSLRRRRWDEADRDAVFAAHYAADLTQPLHTVINYDGQLTGQRGVHARFETDLVNALSGGWRLEPQPATFEADLRARIFEEAIASFSCRNLVFASDHIAVSGRTYLDPRYTAAFYKLAGPLAEKRLTAGASFVSSLWYTAWVRAGKPPLPGKHGM